MIRKSKLKTEPDYRPLFKYHVSGILIGVVVGVLFGLLVGGPNAILGGVIVCGFVGELVGLLIGRALT